MLWLTILCVVIVAAVLLIVAGFIFSERKLRKVDIFGMEHNYKVGRFMKIRKNATGGFFHDFVGSRILYLFLTTLFF